MASSWKTLRNELTRPGSDVSSRELEGTGCDRRVMVLARRGTKRSGWSGDQSGHEVGGTDVRVTAESRISIEASYSHPSMSSSKPKRNRACDSCRSKKCMFSISF